MLGMHVNVSFKLRFSVSLGIGDRGGHSKDVFFGLGVRSRGESLMISSDVEDVMDRCEGVT